MKTSCFGYGVLLLLAGCGSRSGIDGAHSGPSPTPLDAGSLGVRPQPSTTATSPSNSTPSVPTASPSASTQPPRPPPPRPPPPRPPPPPTDPPPQPPVPEPPPPAVPTPPPCELTHSQGSDGCAAALQCISGSVDAQCRAAGEQLWECGCSGDMGSGSVTVSSQECANGAVACITELTSEDDPQQCETLHQGRSNSWCDAQRICSVEPSDGAVSGEHRRMTSCRHSHQGIWDCSCETASGTVAISVDFGDDDYPCPRFLSVCEAYARKPVRRQCHVAFEGNDRTSCELEANCHWTLEDADGATFDAVAQSRIECTQVEAGQWHCPCLEGWIAEPDDPRLACRAAASRCLDTAPAPVPGPR